MRPFKLITLCLLLTACSSPQQEFKQAPQTSYVSPESAPYLAQYNRWQGVPYRLGGDNFSGVDCSAFVQAIYQDVHAYSLPRTTAHQVKIGKEIDYQDAKTGDLVFFKTGRKTRHVGIYLDGNTFMHASTSKGVVLSRLDNPYWASAFWQFRQVLDD